MLAMFYFDRNTPIWPDEMEIQNAKVLSSLEKTVSNLQGKDVL
jgi:hypothetical protein